MAKFEANGRSQEFMSLVPAGASRVGAAISQRTGLATGLRSRLVVRRYLAKA